MDPEAIIRQHADMGRSLFHFDAKKGMSINSPADLLKIKQYANEHGLDPTALMNTMRRGASEGIIGIKLQKYGEKYGKVLREYGQNLQKKLNWVKKFK